MSAPIIDSSPTAGYRMNHFMLRITHPTRSLYFYTKIMGMCVIFTRNVGPLTVYYLGYPLSAEHRANPEKYAEDTSQHTVLTQTLGLLELVHFHSKAEEEGAEEGSGQVQITSGSGEGGQLGFNHLGFTVPDVGAAIERLRGEGVPIVKDVGEGPNGIVPITRWELENGGSGSQLSEGFSRLFRQLGFVRDPDGYLIELVPQVLQ